MELKIYKVKETLPAVNKTVPNWADITIENKFFKNISINHATLDPVVFMKIPLLCVTFRAALTIPMEDPETTGDRCSISKANFFKTDPFRRYIYFP